MRRVCLQLASAILVAATLVAAEEKLTAEKILALEGEALFKAASHAVTSRRNQLSTDDVLALTEKLGAELSTLPEDAASTYAFGTCFEDAAKTAGVPAVDRLAAILVRLDAGEYQRRTLLPVLAALLAERELATIEPAKFRLKFENADVEVPEKLRDAPADLVHAWQQFKRVRQPMEARLAARADEPTIDFQDNRKAFHALVDDVMLGRGKDVSEQLLQYGWGGWCGTGADSLDVPRSIALFVALLREGRIAEAVGASLDMPDRAAPASGADEKNVRIEFLKRCGLDWENLFAGAQLEAEIGAPYSVSQLPFVRELAAYGTDRGAALLAQMARRADADASRWYARAVGALVAKPKPRGLPDLDDDAEGAVLVSFDGREIKRVSKQSISASTRAELLNFLEELAQPTTSTDLALEVISALGGAWEQRSKPALRRLLEHPAHGVTIAAARALRALGEKIDIPAKKPPVRFRVLLNGEPLPAGTSVGWKLAFATNGSVSSVEEVNEEGIIEIERENFSDPERPLRAVMLSTSSVLKDAPAQPMYDIQLPVPADLDQVITADAVVLPCTLMLRSPLQRPLTGEANVVIRKRDTEDPTTFSSSVLRNIRAAVDVPVALPALQPDLYELEVSVPGAAQVKQQFAVEAGAQTLEVNLSGGTDVRVEFVQPNGVRNQVHDRLFENFEPVARYSDEQGTYRGLPPGNYHIHIAGSEEEAELSGRATKPGPDEVPYRGRDVAFTITENSPPLLDLGEILLEPVKR